MCACCPCCTCVCKGVTRSSPHVCCVYTYMCMSRCHTFRQLPVKMPHLSAGMCTCVYCFVTRSSPHTCLLFCVCVCVCVCVHVHVYVKVSHLSAATSQDASSFGWHVYMCKLFCHTLQSMYMSAFLCVCVYTYMCMPRCHTFRQIPVKMPHLSAGMCTCVCCFVTRSSPRRCLLFYVCVHVHVYAKVSHLLAATSQDASSFGWHVYICMWFCHTFQSAVCRRTCVCRWVLVQVPHLLVGVCVCVCVCVYNYVCVHVYF